MKENIKGKMLKKRKKPKLEFGSVLVIIGSLLIIGGILLGAYVGVWVMFIGGTVQVLDALRAPQLVSMDIAVGVAKILLCECASLITIVVSGLGMIFIDIA